MPSSAQISLAVVLAQVDGEIGDPVGMAGVAAERGGAERPTHPLDHLRAALLHEMADGERNRASETLLVEGISIDVGGCGHQGETQ